MTDRVRILIIESFTSIRYVIRKEIKIS
ncbi:unnamed protein product, partial [Adineta steineri]